MPARVAIRSYLACLILLTVPSVRSEPPAANDRYGDPLPDGAIARLGTVRLRHNGDIGAAAFSPDGKTLAVGDSYSAVRFWDLATGKEIAERRLLDPRAPHPVRALGFSSGGAKLTVVDFTGCVHQWEPAARKLDVLWTDVTDVNDLWLIRFSSDGETLALLGGDRKQVRLRDRATGKVVRTWKNDKYATQMMSFSPDGKSFAIGREDGKIHLLDVRSGKELLAFSWNPERSSFNFSPDGKALVWWSMTETAIHFCDPATGEEVRTWKNPKTVRLVDYSSDGKRLGVLDTKGTIRLLDCATGGELRAWKGGGSFLFSPDGKFMAAPTASRSLQVWETATGKPLRQEVGHSGEVRAVAFSPDGKIVASATMWGEKSIRLWDAATGRPLASCADYERGAVTLAFSPDGKILASGGMKRAIRLWDAATGRLLRGLTGHENGASAIAFSRDGKLLASEGSDKLLASGGYDETVRLWGVVSGKEVRRFAVGKSVQSVAFAPDGKSLATADDKVIHLRDMVKGEEIRQFQEKESVSDFIAISPDGKLLASGTAPSNSLVLWDMSTGKVVLRLTGPEKDGILRAIVFSPDGKTLAVADMRQFPSEQEERIHLWDTATGQSRGTFRAPPGGVASLAFSPDGKILAAGNEDTTILLWDMTRLAAKP